jgi:hypothetical protein
MRFRKRLAAVASVLALVGGMTAVVQVVTAAPASAHSCLGGGVFGNYKRGWDTEQHIANGGSEPSIGVSGIEGSSSYIYTRAVDVWCANDTTYTNFSTSWNIVQDEDADTHFAQAGTTIDVTSIAFPCTHWFAEQWAPTGDRYNDSSGCLTVGVKHAYRNLMVLSGSTYHVVSSYDGGAILTSTYDPFSYWSPSYYGFDIGFEAETYYYTTAAEGNFSVETNYTAMGVQRWTDDGQWSACHIVLARANDNNPPYMYTGDQDCSDVSTWESGL